MIIMIANNSGAVARQLSTQYSGSVGHLYSPGGQRGPFPEFPYALDNGKYPCWKAEKPWSEEIFIDLCDWAYQAEQKPAWVLVPDEVTDPVRTLELWKEWSPFLAHRYGWDLAFAVQDGHTPKDVPIGVDIVFIGGSGDWKSGWKNKAISLFCRAFSRVHVGRINGIKGLRYCAAWGAESCDGTGWFRGDQNQLDGLEVFLHEQKYGDPQRRIPFGIRDCRASIASPV